MSLFKKKSAESASAEPKDVKTTEVPVVEEEQPVVIMPTFDVDKEKETQKVDLSGIIPEGPTVEENADEEKTEAALILESKDKILKTDGVVTIGTLTEEGATVKPGANFPEQIDVELRKRNKQAALKSKRKSKKNNTFTDEQKKALNTNTLIVIGLIAILAGLVYYILHRKTEKDFTPLPVTVELGDKLPLRTSSYVKPGIGKSVNELTYVLDKSQVIVDKVGVYEFTVTYKGTTKTGKVTIQDTTSPELIVRDLIIKEGTVYTSDMFVKECHDWSGCEYSFEDKETTEKYRTAGEYEVIITATDPYGNKTAKKAKLTIEEQGMVKKFFKTEPYNAELGYELKTTYDLHFTGFMDDSILLRGYEIREYTYHDDAKYETDRESNRGNPGWSFDDENKIITYESDVLNTINRSSRMNQIIEYLENEGYQNYDE